MPLRECLMANLITSDKGILAATQCGKPLTYRTVRLPVCDFIDLPSDRRRNGGRELQGSQTQIHNLDRIEPSRRHRFANRRYPRL